MSARRFTVRKLFLAVASVSTVSIASATTYTDASNDQVTNGHNAATDIRSVAVTDSGGIVSFLVTLAPTTDLSNNGSGDYYVQYQFGLQTYSTPSGVAGASDGGLTTSPDPYTNPMFISTGMTDFIQAEFSSFPGGVYGGAGYGQGWQPSSATMVGLAGPLTVTLNPGNNSFTMTVPASQLGPVGAGGAPAGLTAGMGFKFDLWTTYSGGTGPIDALDNPNVLPNPFGGPSYDSATATGSTFNTTTYTIVSGGSTATTGSWNINAGAGGSGSWNTAANWSSTPAYPHSAGDSAVFPTSLTVGGTVTLDGNQTVASLFLNNTNSYTIASGTPSTSTLTINGNGGAATQQIAAQLGSQTITAPVVLTGGATTTLSASASSSLTLSGGLSGAGPVIINGGGAGSGSSVTLTGANTYSGATTVNSGGTLNVGRTTPTVAAGSLPAGTTLNSGGLTVFAATSSSGILKQTLTAINLTFATDSEVIVANPASHANRTVLTTGSLVFAGATGAWAGLVDLNGNDMIVQGGGATSLANITNQLKEGFNAPAGYWNGTAGIISTTAATDTKHLMTLGSRLSGGGTFDGVTTTTNDVLVKYTYYGDANLDGSINGADYQQIDLGFGSHLTGWSNGDFNYDGVVDGSDFSLIDNTFNQINATGASPLALMAGSADLVTPGVVPEPMSLSLMGLGAMALLSGRRRKTV